MFGTINRVISLGNWCSTKATMNLYFNPNEPWSKTKKGHADLFDWMFMCDYNHLANALYNNLDDVFEKNDLIKMDNIIAPTGEIVVANGIYNAKYKMIWPHLFDWVSGFELKEKFDTLFEDSTMKTIQSKMNYLKDRFISAKDKRTLYIITYDNHINIPEFIRPVRPSFETLVNVRNGLRHIRGNDHFILLFITPGQSSFVHENIILTNNEDTRFFFNTTISQDSRRIFESFTFELD